MVGEIDDLALLGAVDRAVRRIDKALQRLGMPVIAPGLPLVAVHALLHHRPFGVSGDEEAVQIKVKPILHRRAVDLGYQSAGAREFCAVEADAVTEQHQLVRRLARMLAAAAADIDAELILQRSEPALQRADHRGGDARGMPVHSHHGAERLEPERMRQPLEKRMATVMMHNRLRDDRAERRHAGREPGWNPAAMQGKIGAAGSSGHDDLEIAQFGDGCT